MVEGWDWVSLPESYKSSPRLTATHSQDHLKVNAEVVNDPTPPDLIQDDSALPQDLALLHDLPTTMVK